MTPRVWKTDDGRWGVACVDPHVHEGAFVETYSTEARAQQVAELHVAFEHTHGGCASCAHPANLRRQQ